MASAPTIIIAVQEGFSGVRVVWNPPNPLGNTTGYRIYYSGGSSGSVDVRSGFTSNHLVTGLQSGISYTITLVATSQYLPSEGISTDIKLSEFYMA